MRKLKQLERSGRWDASKQFHGFKVRVFREPNVEYGQCEQDLEELSVDVPLTHRTIWSRVYLSQPMWFVAVQDGSGKCHCGFGIEVINRKSLPGAIALRVSKFGSSASSGAREAALHYLLEIAKINPRIVRIHVEAFAFDEQLLEIIEKTLVSLGFDRIATPRSYQETVVIDLKPRVEDILASLHATARRHIRAVRKWPVAVREISDLRFAKDISRLIRETMSRTGGRAPPADWAQRIAFSNQFPGLSRIVGLFHEGSSDNSTLLAFAWGCINGNCVQYTVAASTRQSELRLPLGYALAWDLVTWGKEQGVELFDFGGITTGTHGDSVDPLGGTSDFKRYFTTNKIRVGSEWVFEPHPVLAQFGDIVSAGVRLLFSIKLFPGTWRTRHQKERVSLTSRNAGGRHARGHWLAVKRSSTVHCNGDTKGREME